MKFDALKAGLDEFVRNRDWQQFHSPKNLSMALSVEASEIVELFQWLKEEESANLSDKDLQKLKDEIGDVFLYLLLLASKYNIDVVEAAGDKLEKNKEKYPVDMAKGSARKYKDLDE